jgi:hypothetical protein
MRTRCRSRVGRYRGGLRAGSVVIIAPRDCAAAHQGRGNRSRDQVLLTPNRLAEKKRGAIRQKLDREPILRARFDRKGFRA